MSLQPDIAMTVDRDGPSASEIAQGVTGRKMSALSVIEAALARLVDEFALPDETEPASVFAA